jgi:hypothetical protein
LKNVSCSSLRPDVLAGRHRIEDAIPSRLEVKDWHIKDKHWIAGPLSAAACSIEAGRYDRTKRMNKLSDPASSPELAALRARFARSVPAPARLEELPPVWALVHGALGKIGYVHCFEFVRV